MTQPQPMKPLTVDLLTADELADLEAQGRIQGGKVLDAPKAPKVAPAAPLATNDVPDMPVGVRERIEAASKLQSSFVQQEGGKVTSSSDDGGKVAAAIETPEVNPDWIGKPKEDPIEYEDKMAFLAHLLGGRFVKTYQLFGGRIKLTFQTRTGSEESMCQEQAWLDEKREGHGNPNAPEAIEQRFGRYHNYRITGALAEIQHGDDVPIQPKPFASKPNPDAHLTSIGVAYQELLKFPQALLVSIMKHGVMFESLVARLTLAADKPDFWKADSGS